MTKQTFLAQLGKGLSALPQDIIAEQLAFYSEMIDDRMEEGASEEDAVLAAGSVDEIAAQITAEISPAQAACAKRRLTPWETVFLVLGSPIWISLLVAAGSVVLSLYLSVWAAVISLWAVFASLTACAAGGIAAGLLFTCTGNPLAGIVTFGAGAVCAGGSILFFYGCKAVTKGVLTVSKKLVMQVVNRARSKEVA